MAQPKKFVIAFGGSVYHSYHVAIDNALKKFFSPSLYEIVFPKLDKSVFDDVELRLFRARGARTFPFEIPTFHKLEAEALTALETMPQAHCALVVDVSGGNIQVGKLVQHQFKARALLVEAIGQKSWDATLNNLIPYSASIEMPQLMPNLLHPDQLARGTQTVVRSVIEAWGFRSGGYDGILRKMNKALA